LKEEEEKPVAKIIRKENKKTKIQSLGWSHQKIRDGCSYYLLHNIFLSFSSSILAKRMFLISLFSRRKKKGPREDFYDRNMT
jgi:spore coat polysaccharide biosynthesis predicted glycosyltransferase SpsG